jgi:hypothetical protein
MGLSGTAFLCPFFYSTLFVSTASGLHTFRSFPTLMYSIIHADASFSAFSPCKTFSSSSHPLPLPAGRQGERGRVHAENIRNGLSGIYGY